MSDTELKTPNKTGASGAAWSDAEKIAYLIVLCENEGKVEAKIANAPIPAGRSIVSCKKLLWRLKGRHKDDIEKIRNGEAISGEASTPKPKPASASKKRKTAGEEESPKKKSGGRKKKVVSEPEVEDDEEVFVTDVVKDEDEGEEMEV